MTETKGNPTYHVGDVVRFVDEPYNQCPFWWTPGMNKYCGVTTEIREVLWVERSGCYAYKAIGCNNYSFCKNCFVTQEEEDDTEYDSAMTAGLILEQIAALGSMRQ